MKKTDYLEILRTGGQLDTGQQLRMTAILSIPAILAQISSVMMEYIDASMVGRLGAEASAAIGLAGWFRPPRQALRSRWHTASGPGTKMVPAVW